jgi:hypothetical protein
MTAFDTALAFVLKEEGGYVNNPRDPGGETNLGVTRRTWQAYTGKIDVDMHSLTPASVGPLYKDGYWRTMGCDGLPPALALCVFDFGVNAGCSRAVRLLQSIVNALPDGSPGPVTFKAVQAFAAAHTLPELVRRYQQGRRDYYRLLSTFATFGKGWLARCDRIETQALRMVS